MSKQFWGGVVFALTTLSCYTLATDQSQRQITWTEFKTENRCIRASDNPDVFSNAFIKTKGTIKTFHSRDTSSDLVLYVCNGDLWEHETRRIYESNKPLPVVKKTPTCEKEVIYQGRDLKNSKKITLTSCVK